MPRNKAFQLAVRLTGVAFVLFQLYTAATGAMLFMIQQPLHVMFALVLTFALVGWRGKSHGDKVPLWDIVLIGLTLWTTLYIVFNSGRIMSGAPLGTVNEAILGAILTVIILESGRRRIGITFPILTILAILYAVLGHVIPGSWGHFPISPRHVLESLYLSNTAIWGTLTGLSATLIASFIIFGAFLLFTEGGQTFVDIALPLTGKMWGGAAKVCTVASAFFGMISGSAIANSAAIGNFTIPLMKKLGYKPEWAAAVEATASTGGIFTPPVMGATAFILAEMVGVSYVRVMAAAVIPAFLFYFGIYWSIDAHAHKNRLAPVPPEMIPPLKEALHWRRITPVFLPLALFVYLMVIGYSTGYAAFWAIIGTLVVYMAVSRSWKEVKQRIKKTAFGLDIAGTSLASVVPLLVCASIVVGLINLTGIGIKFSELVINVGRANIFLTLLLGAVLALILGMGLPVTAAYVLLAAVVAPGLTKLGMEALPVHMFLLYFACISGITPPVCPNVFVTSAIAKSDWWKTGWIATRLAYIIYVIPFIFVYNSALLMGSSPANIVITFLGATWATFVITIGIGGFFLTMMGPLMRVLFFVGGMMVIVPGMPVLQLTGLGITIVVMLILLRQWRKYGTRLGYDPSVVTARPG